MKLERTLIILIGLCFLLSYKQVEQGENYVPNAETAFKMAEAIWLPICRQSIYEDKPFIAKLKNSDVWVVEETLAKGLLGGVPYIKIQKSDGKILVVTHGK